MTNNTQNNQTVNLKELRKRIQDDFDKSGLLIHLNASLGEVKPGQVHLHLPYSESVTQHLGYFHAGATSTIADAAGGFASLTMVPEDQTVMSVEFKINMLAPGQGESLEAISKVIRSGRTLIVTQTDVYALNAGVKKHIAMMQQTNISLPKQGR